MRITPDTNILVRVLIRDNEQQRLVAEAELLRADVIAITLPALCELVWVLSRLYKVSSSDIATAIRTLVSGENVIIDRPAVDAGLAALDAGADFADSVIAHEGRRLGGDTFVSFDRKAVALLKSRNEAARLLA